MSIFFISDLHLDPSRPTVTQAFLTLLEQQAATMDALYILGDFFEVWIGDDDDADLNQQIIDTLRELTDSGLPVYIMHGNRDFLIGQQFCQQSGATLIADPTVIDCYGEPVLLMHGDTLCIDDSNYMAFRAECRSDAWQQAMLAKGIDERRMIAQHMRNESKQANSNKAESIMDVNEAEVCKTMSQYNVNLLIHGHTHRPFVHSHQVKDGTAHRVVLGDWDSLGWLLRYQPDHNYQLESFQIT